MIAESPERSTDVIINMADPPSLLSGVRYGLRSRLATFPSYINFAMAGKHRDEVVRGSSEVVIDGFPRSANTFATIAFQTAQVRPVKIAHHLHAAAQLITGVKLGIPTLVLIREPADTVLSEAIRAYPVPLRRVVRAYCRFYEALIPYLKGMAVAEFRTVTTNFGSIVQALNRRFGSSFGIFDHAPENVAMVFRLIEEREKRREVKVVDEYLAGRSTLENVWTALRDFDRRGVPAAQHENAVPRPSASRTQAKARLSQQLQQPGMAELLAQAQRAYYRVSMES